MEGEHNKRAVKYHSEIVNVDYDCPMPPIVTDGAQIQNFGSTIVYKAMAFLKVMFKKHTLQQ